VNVGDMVIRAYMHSAIVPGIIVERKVECLEFDTGDDGSSSYDEVSYVVAWSDGHMTSESAEELDSLNKALNGRSIWKEKEE